MRSLVLSLVVLLLAGCALATQPTPKAAVPLSRQNWQIVEPHLLKAPEVVNLAINRSALARLTSDNSILPSNLAPSVTMTAAATLVDIIAQSSDPLLLTDDEFSQLRLVVEGSRPAAEPFARALSAYILQPDFNCRQPLYFNYFQHRYQQNSSSCSSPVPFLLLDRHEGSRPIWLEPKQVSSIHLVFAGHGQSLASRFGHVALRLVVCPAGDFTEEACNSNLFDHLILGFAAHIDEFELNTFKALSGDYKAYLFASPLMDVYRDYAISEFRDISSIPLNLTSSQRQQLLRQLSEIHWRYSGDYNFFTRNCATLLQDVLRVLIPQFDQQAKLTDNYMRPDSFFAAIKETTMVEGYRLNSLQQAEQQGFFFPSTKPFYDQALQVVMAAMGKPTFTDVNSYLRRLPSQRLDEIFKDQHYLELLSDDGHRLEAQLLLEELALVRNERQFMASGSRYLQSIDIMDDFINEQNNLNDKQWLLFEDCFLRPIKEMTNPIPRLSFVPLATESLPIVTPRYDCRSADARKQLSAILDIVNTGDHEQWQQVLAAAHILAGTTQNILILKELRNESQ